MRTRPRASGALPSGDTLTGMPRTRLERETRLDDLSSEELEEIAFGPDPSQPRRRRRRRRAQGRTVGRQRPAPERADRREEGSLARKRKKTASGGRPRIYCYACGESIDARAEICPDCGVRQRHPRQRGRRVGEKTRLAAGLLALLFGVFGVHKFYLGKTGLGVLYLLFFWTGLPALAGFIEFILFMLMSDAEFDETYN